MFRNIYLIYMYKDDLALNNLQWLICHKTQTNQGTPAGFYVPVQEYQIHIDAASAWSWSLLILLLISAVKSSLVRYMEVHLAIKPVFNFYLLGTTFPKNIWSPKSLNNKLKDFIHHEITAIPEAMIWQVLVDNFKVRLKELYSLCGQIFG